MIVEGIADYIFQRSFIYQLITTLTVYVVILSVRFYIRRNRRYQLFKYYGIPGPEPSMIDGNTTMFYKNNRVFEVEMENFKKYGLYWSTFQGDWPAIVTTDPALLRHAFLENYEVFSERTRPFMDIGMAYGILFAPRPRWKFFRRILAAPFNKFTSRGQASVQFIEDCVRLMVDYIDHKIDVAKKNRTQADINMYGLMKSNALYMISELAIKLKVEVTENESNVKQLDDHLEKSDKTFFRLALMFPFLREVLAHLINTLQIHGYMKVIYKSLHERLLSTSKKIEEDMSKGLTATPVDEPILDTLVRYVHFKQMTVKEYLGNAEALLFAGYDTTSTTLIYTLWCLSKYQQVQERLRDELMSQGTESKYLEQVLNESMRLYPVVASFTTRLATRSIEFNGLIIPEDTLIIYNGYIMHRNPAYWKEPEKFDPDRFAEGIEIDPIYFAPFGLGERKCLGYKLAMLEMKIILTELILRYKLILKSPQQLQMCTEGFSLTKPAEQIKIVLEKRNTMSKQ